VLFGHSSQRCESWAPRIIRGEQHFLAMQDRWIFPATIVSVRNPPVSEIDTGGIHQRWERRLIEVLIEQEGNEFSLYFADIPSWVTRKSYCPAHLIFVIRGQVMKGRNA
jgi:hypothetical protein